MAKAHSYTITKKNNKTENEAIDYLLSVDDRFFALDRQDRKHVMEMFGLDSSFSRAFDLVLYTGRGKKKVIELGVDDVILVELKTTQKKHPENPRGFFFGATENEFKLARKLGDKYKFCFVSLHPESRSFALLTLSELEKLIRTNRTQYQINL